MKLKIIAILLAASVLGLLFYKGFTDQEKVHRGEDPLQQQIDSIEAQAKTQLIASLKDQIKDSADHYAQLREEYENQKTITKVITKFIEIQGEPDTTLEGMWIDSAQIDRCNTWQMDAVSLRSLNSLQDSVIFYQGEDLKSLEAIKMIQQDQLQECNDERDLWLKWDQTPRWRWIKRCRLKKKIYAQIRS